METTRNSLSEYAKICFNNLKNIINLPLYYYGSIQRIDYVENESDIDVSIYTDNVNHVKYAVQTFFGIENKKVKHIVMQVGDKLIHGYKLVVKNKPQRFRAEISIFDKKYESIVRNEHLRKMHLPVIISFQR